MGKPRYIINELGQKVREYDWEDYQRRISLRKIWDGKGDLNGKTLIIKHTWGIGDILYSTPALRGLKEKYPDVKICYISTHPEVLENNPDVDQNLHFMDAQSYVELTDQMTEDWYWLDYDTPLKGGYDYKVHLRTKPALNEFMLSLLRKNPSDLNEDERNFIDQASCSVISRYRMVALDMYCWHAFVDPPNKTIHYFPYDHELEVARELMQPLRKGGFKIITLIPHASTVYKDYPYWRKVIELCPKNYFWFVLDSHPRNGESWIGPSIYNLSGAFKTRQTAALVIESDLNCSSDTGLLYPKIARGGKAVVVYGPHQWEPFLHHFQPQAHGLRVPYVTGLLPNNEFSCSVGCFIDTQSCHKAGEPAPCLQQLSPKLVAEEVMKCLEE